MKRNSRRNAGVIKEWNKGGKDQSEIGDMFGISKKAVSHILARARKHGVWVRDSAAGTEKNPERNSGVLKEWNLGQKNMSEVGGMFGISRGTIAGILKRGRNNGLFVMAVDPSEAKRRQHNSMRKQMGDDAYLAALRDKLAYSRSFRVSGSAS